MGNAFLHGFGNGTAGAGLNYRIVSCASEAALPAVSGENTIAVITGTAITGHSFCASEPEEPYEGMVWIQTGTQSDAAFCATKNDSIMLYPLSVWQYVNGVWEEKTAKNYSGGVWSLWWNGQLYTPGNEWTDVTGGWTGIASQSTSASSVEAADPQITKDSDSIAADSTAGGSVLYCIKKIDLTNFSTLTFQGTFTRGGSSERNMLAACWEEMGTYYYTSAAASVGMSAASGTLIQLDISALTGAYYVGIGLTASTVEITRCVLS